MDQLFCFVGQYVDDSMGLYYNIFWFYDLDVGCFINQDLIGFNGGVNVYYYVFNLVGWVDLWGLVGSYVFGFYQIFVLQLLVYNGQMVGMFYYVNDVGGFEFKVFFFGGFILYFNYVNVGYVEGQFVLFMCDNGIFEGLVFYNNFEGMCGFCVNMIEIFLFENVKMIVVLFEGVILVKCGVIGEIKVFMGNSNFLKFFMKGGC